MPSLVEDLQADALRSDVPLTDLLRKALVVARKLKLNDFQQWCDGELNGFKSENAPSYRRIVGQVKGYDHFHGRWIPFVVPDDAEAEKAMTQKQILSKVSEIESIVADATPDKVISIPLAGSVQTALMEGFNSPFVPKFVLPKNALCGILDTVRNTVLEWSLKLEEDGIIGDGMSFSKQEKEIATAKASELSPQIVINNFNGNTSGSAIQQGSPSAKQQHRS